jgi:hypothetical protein
MQVTTIVVEPNGETIQMVVAIPLRSSVQHHSQNSHTVFLKYLLLPPAKKAPPTDGTISAFYNTIVD